jgi:cytochrome b pre-mRNA-processing protein 3
MRLNGMMAGGPPPGDGGEEENIFTRDRPPSGGEKRVRQVVVLAVVLAVLGMVWAYLQGGENRALNAMAPVQRAALFQETLDEIRLTCLTDAGVKPGGRLEKRCQKQAEFLTRFTECDAACRQEIAPFLRGTAQ